MIESERMVLVPATLELLEADLTSPEGLGEKLGATVPPDWPPPFHTDELVNRMLTTLADPAAADWWMHYFIAREGAAQRLIGEGGYKGPPDADGAIEIGYALVPSARGHGYATEAALAMIDAGWERGAQVVRAETLPELAESMRVMERAGMTPARSERAGVVAYEVTRA